ncbi:MAG: DUF2835 domain-containing protein [Granulosicoccus sp.]
MPRKIFSLDISAAEFESVYRGVGKVVVTRSDDGKTLQFPATELRKFVSRSGVQGRFAITFSNDHKLLDIKKIN